ncbi:MAG: hypothetical protein M1836_003734 [Candelina mexicana]|nr:MAG: hypothetical protein M1836_003734 [Candelina mexicana]
MTVALESRRDGGPFEEEMCNVQDVSSTYMYFWISVHLLCKVGPDGSSLSLDTSSAFLYFPEGQGPIDFLPAPGTNIQFRWVQGTAAEHQQDEECPWEGTVIDSMNSGTEDFNFIVLARKHKGGRYLANDATVKRQMKALHTSCFGKSRSDLDDLRHALFATHWVDNGKPWNKRMSKVNLRNTGINLHDLKLASRQGNDTIKVLEKKMIELFRLNKEQVAAYQKTMSPRGGLLMLVGPPATGKTKTLSFLTVMLLCYGHKQLLTAASKWATNRIMDDIIETLNESSGLWRPFLGREPVTVRLHRPASEVDFTKSQAEWDPTTNLPKPAEDVDLMIRSELVTLLEEAAKFNRDVQGSVLLHLHPHFRHKEHSLGNHIINMCLKAMDREKDADIELDFDEDPTSRFRQLFEMFINPTIRMTPQQKIELWTNITRCKVLQGIPFNFAGVDECAQFTEPDTIIILVTSPGHIVARIIAGDEKQLQPTLTSASPNEGYLQGFLSLFPRFRELNFSLQVVLRLQYRMDEEISAFPRGYAYRGELFDAPPVVGRHRPLNIAVKDVFQKSMDPLVTVFTSKYDRWNPRGRSKWDLVANLLSHEGIKANDITYLTYYQAQKKYTTRQLNAANVDTQPDTGVDIKTVDSSQGSQRGIIILDFVLSTNAMSKMTHVSSFLREFNRLNVALLRGMDGLVIISNHKMLDESGKYYGPAPNPFLNRYTYWPLPALLKWVSDIGVIKALTSTQGQKRPLHAIEGPATGTNFIRELTLRLTLSVHSTRKHSDRERGSGKGSSKARFRDKSNFRCSLRLRDFSSRFKSSGHNSRSRSSRSSRNNQSNLRVNDVGNRHQSSTPLLLSSFQGPDDASVNDWKEFMEYETSEGRGPDTAFPTPDNIDEIYERFEKWQSAGRTT